jgi:hypothetical protein
MGDAQMLKQFLKLNTEHKKMIRHCVRIAYLYENEIQNKRKSSDE